jgi:hypothetical protein
VKPEFKEVMDKIKSGELAKTLTIAPVDYYLISKTAYSFHFYAVYERNGKDVLTEMLYDLRYRQYYIKRNGKEVKFNEANLDTVIPRHSDGIYREEFYTTENKNIFFDMVSVEENKDMYKEMVRVIGCLGFEYINMSSRALIRLITKYHKLELIYKAGIPLSIMKKGVMGLIETAGTENITKVHKIFGMSKSQFKFFNEFNGFKNIDGDIIRKTKFLQQRDMDFYRGFREYITSLEEKYDMESKLVEFTRNNTFSNFIKTVFHKSRGEIGYVDNFYDFIYKYDVNHLKLVEYLLFECHVSQGINYYTAFAQYKDYYNMCKDMRYERFDKYPKYLKTQHDIIAMNYKSVNDKLEVQQFEEATKKYQYLEDKLAGYIFISPKNADELVFEGNSLSHCVGSYVRNVSRGRTQILFLRDAKKPEESLITLEVREDRIVQAKGFSNRKPIEEEDTIIRRYAKRKKLSVLRY